MSKISTFDRLDNYLKDKKSSELSLVFLVIFLAIGFISYTYIFPVSNKTLKDTQRSYKNLQNKLKQEQSYLRSVTRNGDDHFVVKKIAKELAYVKNVLEYNKFANTYVDNKLKDLSYLLFNDKNWANFLDSITARALKNDVRVKLIKNTFNEPNLQKIEQVLTINLAFNGNFNNVMKFINGLEESELVVDVFELKLQSSNTIDGTLNIAVWGMKY